MAILGMRFNSLEARREKGKITHQIKVRPVPKVTGVKETDIPMLGKKALSLEFEFVAEYDPNIGNIKMSGEIFYITDNNDAVIKKWKSDKELSEDVKIEVHNHLYRTCLVKVVNLADDLQLPPPMPIPRLRPKAAK